jgi:branched-subunit amino acid ABC-type transport system permease component
MFSADLFTSFIQYVVLGLMLGGVYALAAMGLALLFGVANLSQLRPR